MNITSSIFTYHNIKAKISIVVIDDRYISKELLFFVNYYFPYGISRDKKKYEMRKNVVIIQDIITLFQICQNQRI